MNTQRHPVRFSALCLFALVSGLAACGNKSRSSSATWTYVEGTAGTNIQAHDIVVVFDETVRYEYTLDSSDGESTTTTRINGLDFELRSDRIVIGEHEFEGLVDGDEVEIGVAGISVNGERRWDFPELPNRAE